MASYRGRLQYSRDSLMELSRHPQDRRCLLRLRPPRLLPTILRMKMAMRARAALYGWQTQLSYLLLLALASLPTDSKERVFPIGLAALATIGCSSTGTWRKGTILKCRSKRTVLKNWETRLSRLGEQEQADHTLRPAARGRKSGRGTRTYAGSIMIFM